MTDLMRKQRLEMIHAYCRLEGMSPAEAWRALDPEADEIGDGEIRSLLRTELDWYSANTDTDTAAPSLIEEVRRRSGHSVAAPAATSRRRKPRRQKTRRCAGVSADRPCRTRVRRPRARCGNCRRLREQQYNRGYYQANRAVLLEKQNRRNAMQRRLAEERRKEQESAEMNRWLLIRVVASSYTRYPCVVRFDEKKNEEYLYCPSTDKSYYPFSGKRRLPPLREGIGAYLPPAKPKETWRPLGGPSFLNFR